MRQFQFEFYWIGFFCIWFSQSSFFVFGSDFFCIWFSQSSFPNPSFSFEPSFCFLLKVFCSNATFWHWFCFFFYFWIWFFEKWLFTSTDITFCVEFFWVNENSLNLYVRTGSAMFFISSSPMIRVTWLRGIDFFIFSDFYFIALKICVREVICSAFRSIAWLTSLRNDFWTRLMSFKFYERLLVKDQ